MPNIVSIKIEADGTAAIVGVDGVSSALGRMGRAAGDSQNIMDKAWASMAKGVAAGNLMSKAFEVVAEKAMQMAQYIKDSAYYAAKVETLGIAMHAVGNNAGYSSAQMDAFAQKVSAQGITTESSRQALTMMAAAQMDVSKASELARVAQDAAVIGNINSSEAFSRMTQGIRSGEVEVLRTIGINVNFERSYQQLAQQIGVATTDLTEHQKVLARQNAVMAYGVNIQGTYEAAMGSTGKQITSMARYYDELKLAFGEAFAPALGALIENTTIKLKNLLQWFGENRGAMQEFARNMKDIINAAAHPIDAAVRLMKSPFASDEDIAQQNLDDKAWQAEQKKIKMIAESRRIALQDAARLAAEERERKAIADKKAEQEISSYNSFVDNYNGRISKLEETDSALNKHEQEIIKVQNEYAKLRENYPKQIAAINDLEKYELQEIRRKQALGIAISDTAKAIKELEDASKSLADVNPFGAALPSSFLTYKAPQFDTGASMLNVDQQYKPRGRFTSQYSLMGPGPTQNVDYRQQTDEASRSAFEQLEGDLQNPYNKKLNQLNRYYEEKQAIIAKYDAKNAQEEQRRADATIALDKQVAEQRKQLTEFSWNAVGGIVSSQLGQIASMMDKSSADQFAAYKAMMMAQATINAAMAISNILASPTAAILGPFAIPLAITTGAIAAAQIALIAQQKPPGRALGGPVNAGTTYLVGERGPELFTPAATGQITSNDKLQKLTGGATSVTNVFQISAGVADTVRAEIMRAVPMITNHTLGAVNRAINGGTQLSAAVGRM